MKRRQKRFMVFFLCMVTLFLSLSYIYCDEGREKVKIKLFPVTEHMQGSREGSLPIEKEGQKKRKTIDDSKISVLIKTQGFSSLYHQKLQITSHTPFIVWKDGKKKRYHAGECVDFSANTGKKGRKWTVRIEPIGKGRLQLLSLRRQDRHPSYRGSFQVKVEKRGLLLVNTLYFREYLYAVVSSEISSENIEALKAQAVCARTYAANKRRASEYRKYGADLDDSENCQVYNNVPENADSRRAVAETEGMVLKKDGRKIPVYYFSTSWGYTASGKEVWNTEEQIPYLKRKFQMIGNCEMEPDLSKEEAFRMFLDQQAYVSQELKKRYVFETYDSKSPWYRWKIEISWKELEKRIWEKIAACYQAYPNLVLFKKNGETGFQKGNLWELGNLKNIYPGKRDVSGLVTELVLEGSKCTVAIRTQYSVRKLLNFEGENIVLADGTVRSGFTLLPSAAFYLERHQKGDRDFLLIKGGGFGHGTGMSQYGASVQAGQGWSYEKILHHYFDGISIEEEVVEK